MDSIRGYKGQKVGEFIMLFRSNISGYEVTYCNVTEIYQILDGEAVLKESRSFNTIEKYIETNGSGEKKEKKKRLEKKIIFCRYGKYEEGIITSLAEESRYGSGYQVWLIIDGKRQKELLRDCLDFNNENLNKITEIKLFEKQREILNKNIATIHNSLSKVTLTDLISGTGEGI